MPEFRSSLLLCAATAVILSACAGAPDEADPAGEPAVPSAGTITTPATATPVAQLTLSDGTRVEFYQFENELLVAARSDRGAPPPAAFAAHSTAAPFDPVALYRQLSGKPAPSALVAAVAAARAIPDEGSSDDGEYPIPSSPFDVSAASTARASSCGYSAAGWDAAFCGGGGGWYDQISCHPITNGDYEFRKKGREMRFRAQANTHPLHIRFKYKKGIHWKTPLDLTLLPCHSVDYISSCISCLKRWRHGNIIDNEENYPSRVYGGNHE